MSKTVPSNKWCSFQTDGNWVSLKGVLHIVQRNGATFKHKGQLSFFERNVTSLKDTLHVLTQYCQFLLLKAKLFKYDCNFKSSKSIFEENGHLPEGMLP